VRAPRFVRFFGPFGALSPLNAHHPLNPFAASYAERRPPGLSLGRRHDSVLARLYGKGALDRIPFPNMEWWWNSADFRGRVHGREPEEFSLITNVQLFSLPGGSTLAQGTLAVRNLTRRRRFQRTTEGTLDPGPSCRFSADGWHLHREGGEDDWDEDRGTYHVDVIDDRLRVELTFSQNELTYIGDLGQDPERRGWTDNNPEGNLPYWVTYRSRFGRPQGRLWLPDEEEPFEIETPADRARDVARHPHVRFDHQSVHWSPRDVGGLSFDTLGEALITRPAWLWYHARFVPVEGQSGPREPLNLVAYELRNGFTERVLKRFLAIADDEGRIAVAEAEGLRFEPSGPPLPGKVPAPRSMTFGFVMPGGARGKLTVRARDDQGFTVKYPIAGPLTFEAQEASAQVTGRIRWQGVEREVEGTGTLEVLDFLKSLSV
jgi:hypothetical protein